MGTDEPELLFVYGTLRPAIATGSQRHLVRELEAVGAATVPGLLLDLGDYPGLVDGDGVVHGELLRITDPARLAALDDYEDCGGAKPLFRRERATAWRADGTPVAAWVYRYARPASHARPIASGDYAAHVRGR